MDPFGSSYNSNGFKSRVGTYSQRSDDGLLGGLSGVAKDVKTQLSSRGRSWSHIGAYLGAGNVIYGGLVVTWVIVSLIHHAAFSLGLALGACFALAVALTLRYRCIDALDTRDF
jgi:hypothetical protein